MLTEIRRDQRLSESPLVLRHQDSSQAPEFTEVFEACVSNLSSQSWLKTSQIIVAFKFLFKNFHV